MDCRKGTAAVGSTAAGIDNDLSAGQPGIAIGPADEPASRVHVKRFLGYIHRRAGRENERLNDLFDVLLAETVGVADAADSAATGLPSS